MSAPPRLRFDALQAGYGSTIVLRGVSGQLDAGQVLCVIGRNGVGKSTLMKLLAGFLPPLQGTIEFEGRRFERADPTERRAAGISYSPQERPVFDDLTVRDNLGLMGDGKDLSPFEPFFARFPILARRLGQLAGSLSGGEKKLLALTRALAEGQPLTLLDEPSEGVQWENVLHMQQLIEQHAAEGASFVVVEQNLAFAERIADRYLVLDQGAVTLAGDATGIGREELLVRLRI